MSGGDGTLIMQLHGSDAKPNSPMQMISADLLQHYRDIEAAYYALIATKEIHQGAAHGDQKESNPDS